MMSCCCTVQQAAFRVIRTAVPSRIARRASDYLLKNSSHRMSIPSDYASFYVSVRGVSDDASKAAVSPDGEATKEERQIDLSVFSIPHELEFPDVAGKGGVHFKVTEGELIRRGDAICEIELAEFSFGMDSDEETDTVMGTIHVQKGDSEIEPGTPICTILHPEPPESQED